MEHTYLGDQKFGIYLYHKAIPRELNIPERLESAIGNSTHQLFSWRDAVVGYNQKMPEYRDCVDLKMSPAHWQYLEPQYTEVKSCYEDTENYIKTSLVHYQSMFNISMEYMEAINFIRYSPGQHFQIHTDHGFSYSCTVSSIAYLNDDYEGGELWFPYLDLTYKPVAGDILLFPSTYIYAHAALKVHSGIKYAAVTMFDYNDNNHRYPQGQANDGSASDPTAGVVKAPGRQFTYPKN
jgi:predicted 2-oxoglutarate/Fe(II)-dependent dioxygenase YbiX